MGAGPGPAQGVDADAAREEELHRLRRARGKDARVLEEERTLLWKKQRKAREVRALLVDLDLREIGIVGEIERETWRHTELGISAKLHLAALPGIQRVVAS
jgi:hypothetical protein